MSRKTEITEKIQILPKKVSDKIAAGEVITAPIAVVKELLENSIDAFADKITIRIEEGGKKLISIQDNGVGIISEDIELAFFPHATSKISSVDDFDQIATLGFRGEALASIAAVSRVEIRTKTASNDTGTMLRVEGGDFSSPKPIGAPDGTSVIVEDLFYNTPARLKFLKSDRAETTAIIQFVSKMAIAYPDIRFVLYNGDNIIFATKGDGNLKSAINTVYGVPEDELIRVEKQGFYVYLQGYISPSDVNRKTRGGQIYFVNGRSIESEVFEKSVNDAYSDRLEPGRHPLIYLFLDIKPYRLDVNVHPTKSRVRFYDPKNVGSFIKDGILEALAKRDALPRARTVAQLKQQKRIDNKFYSLKDTKHFVPEIYSEDENQSEEIETVDMQKLLSTMADEILEKADLELRINEKKLDANENLNFELRINENVVDDFENAGVYNIDSDKYNVNSDTSKPHQVSLKIDSLNVLGSVFATYLIAADEGGLFLIDQHAAHERINYEKLLSQRNNKELFTQQLLTPYLIDLSVEAKQSMDLWADWLSALGFETDVFGDKTLAIKAFPAFLSYDEGAAFVNDVIESADSEPPENRREIERIVSKACKTSIKGNQLLDNREIKALLDELAECDNPYNCPHGRPVFIQLSKADLEQMFGRK